MKTLEELFKEFDGKTTIQQEEHLKKLIGVEVEVLGEISNIDSKYINLEVEAEYSTKGRLALKLPYGTLIFISHESSQLGNQLLEYSSGDEVKLATRLTGAHFSKSTTEYYTFALLSLLKLNTRDERVKMEAEQKEAEQKKSGCFVATAVYGSYDHPSVLKLRHFRDEQLCSHVVGRVFIASYYRFGPRLARVVVANSILRNVFRGVLNRFVYLMK